MSEQARIQAGEGRLGVLLPGFGAVATTLVAGVEAVRRGLANPLGSLSQMNAIRLGKRTEGRNPLIREFLPLAGLDDLVFGAWDPIPDNGYESAVNAGVLEARHLDPIRDFLSDIRPMPAVFDKEYVRRLDGPNVKTGADKFELAQQVREDIRRFGDTRTASSTQRVEPILRARTLSTANTPGTFRARSLMSAVCLLSGEASRRPSKPRRKSFWLT